ncbi:Crp/Fnr family transcriptional regulator [Zhouia sp. PK063]|uniref:Crp/Fnr family transcriptional regulator n=1 Tax=Zhouia sp. PK063 TaxID=3373602 RepID=UPI0037942BC3
MDNTTKNETILSMYSELVTGFKNIAPLEPWEEKLICELFHPAHLNKNDFFLKEGQVNNHLAFMKTGLVRYFVYKKEEESTLEFTSEGEFIGEYQSFTTRKKSIQSIQALEDCELLTISYENLQRFFNDTTHGNLIGRLVIEHRFNTMIDQLLSIYMKTPKERYQYFLDHYYHLTQRIPQYLIASYIGVKPASLSRIRRQMAKHIS